MPELRPDYSRLPVHHLGESGPLSGPVVAFCCDDRFAFQARVALASIFLNSPSRSLDLVIFAVDWQERTLEAFDGLARRFGRAVTVIGVGEGMLPASFTNQYLPRATFFRLLVPEIVAADRILYLDADVVAQVDLNEIWRDCRDDMLVGGVPDTAARDWKRRIGFPEPDTYVNNGVLLVNAAAWRKERALGLCDDWMSVNQRRAVLADQDAVNNALAGRVYFIPGRWNVTRPNQPKEWRLDLDSFRGIFHFAGRAKPWMRWAEPALQEFYLHYARLVGLPADYWVEARNAHEAMAEAHWAEVQGNFAKASQIHKGVAEAAIAKLKQLSPKAELELR
jgi:lipopolysaccharide biosynthesis glycosyltransferase